MVGLKKIDEATAQLIVLNEQLEIQKIVVDEKTRACEMILQEITKGIHHLQYNISIIQNDFFFILNHVRCVSGNVNNFRYTRIYIFLYNFTFLICLAI